MQIDRRAFLAGLAGCAALRPLGAVAGGAVAEAAYVAARKDGDGYAAALISATGETLLRAGLPGRGHGAAVSPDRATAVVFARRPGAFALVLDVAGRRAAASFAPPSGRHFYGHGAFSADGRLLYATENDYDAARGVVGVYETSGWRRVGEFETHGVGPHEMLLMADGRTLAVANGGIETHPETPRRKLNLATMAPSLAYLDSRTGDLLERVEAPASLQRLSIRHMAEAPGGEIWWGGQWEGPASERPPLIGVHRRGGEMALIGASAKPALANYVGSVAANPLSDEVAVTSPRGGVVLVWDAAARELVDMRAMPDACGVARAGEAFAVSDGRGILHMASGDRSEAGVAWDNHLAPV